MASDITATLPNFEEQLQIHVPFQETRRLNLFNKTDKQKHVYLESSKFKIKIPVQFQNLCRYG